MTYLSKKKQNKVFQKIIALYYRAKRRVSFWDHYKRSFEFPLWLNHLPLSDAELEECKALLAPKGYTVERNTSGSETIIYPPMDEQKEQMLQIRKELYLKLIQEF